MPLCYKHSECGTTTEKIDITSIPLSTWFVGTKPTVQRVVNSVPDGSYFLLPAYLNRGVLTDWQPQISGKAKVCETSFKTIISGATLAAQREILEEIGFAFSLSSLILHGSELDKRSSVYFFSALMSARAIGSTDTVIRTECTVRATYTDDPSIRISAHVAFVGSESELFTTLATRKRIASSDTGGFIIFAVPKATLLSYIT